MIQPHSSSVQCQVLQSVAVVRRQQVVLAAIVPTDLVRTGQFWRRHGPFPVRVTFVPFRICNETSSPAVLICTIVYGNVMSIWYP